MRPLPAWLLALARVLLGCTFFFSDHGSSRPGELKGFLDFAQTNAFPWYQGILAAVIVPHAQLFGTLVVIAEIAAGIALVLGLATRLAAVVALVLLINYECAKGSPPWLPGIDQAEIVLALIVLVCAAGRVYGVDRWLYARFRNVPLW
jgi:uncharacterized membrane protein YphA (DoxX/SURF4 family)